jgi:Domain of unknown function (DUF3854)
MSQGFPCIALTGIWNGVKANRDENGKTTSYDLIPTLRHLADCKILIAFDRDEKSATIKQVIKARSVLAKSLIEIGCECRSMKWDSKYKSSSDFGDEVMTVTTVTTQTEKIFNLENSPKPPTVDRSIPDTTKFNDDVEYLIVDGKVKWLEIFFHKHAIAKEWKKLATLWGCQTSDLEMRRHNGNKWLLIVKGLTIARLEQILSQNLMHPPQQPSRR